MFRFIQTGLVCVLLLQMPAFGQELAAPAPSSSEVHIPNNYFPKASYFRETFMQQSPKVELQAPVRLSDFVVDGKLELSLRSYLELVLANNTDIAISRLTVETSKNAIMRAYGPFDPLGIASLNSTRNTTPTNDALAGAATLKTLNQPVQLSFQHTLQTGTQYTVGFNGQKSTTNSSFTNFNPAITNNLSMSFAQPLLRNRGSAVNRLPIMVARSRLRGTEYDLSDRILTLVSQAELAYWRAVELRESLKVQQSSLELADTLLKRAQRELELGAISRLDIYQPEFQYAQAEGSVAQFRYLVEQQDNALKRQMGADLDPAIRKLPIVLTETVSPPTDTRTIDAEMTVQRALSLRPDLKSAGQQLDVDELNIRQARNALLPQLNLVGSYNSFGRGGIFYDKTDIFQADGTQSTIINVVPGGLGDAFTQMFGFNYPGYSFGLRLTLPIRNRAAQADMADASIAKRRDMLTVRNTEQQIRLDVLNAVSQVESSKATIALAVKALDFAQKRLDAEQKKYDLGTSTIFLVLQAQNDLIGARSQLVTQTVAYQRNLLTLLRSTGELLEERGIKVD